MTLTVYYTIILYLLLTKCQVCGYNEPRCIVKQNAWLALAKQPDADRSKECYHRRHLFFTENRDLKVVITANLDLKIMRSDNNLVFLHF